MAQELGLEVVQAHALNNIGAARSRIGDRQGLADLERSVEIASAANSPEVIRAYINLGSALSQSGDIAAAARAYDDGLRVGERFGSTDVVHWLSSQRKGIELWRGDWEQALEVADEIIAAERHYLQRGAYAIRSNIRLARGDTDGAVEDILCAVSVARDAKDDQALLPTLAQAAFVHVAAARRAEGEAFADELLALDPGRLESGPLFFNLGWALQDLGRSGELAAPLARMTWESRWISAGRALAAEEFVRAADIYAETGNRFFEAYTRLRAAEAGAPGAQLNRAIDFFEQVGATAYLRRAESLVEATA